MSVSSDDLLALSEQLIERDDECSLRASIGRSYYAVFHQAKIAADVLDLKESQQAERRASHERLISRYESGGKGLRSIAKSIRKAKMTRVAADYDIGESVLIRDAKFHLANCQRVLRQLKGLSCQAARSEG